MSPRLRHANPDLEQLRACLASTRWLDALDQAADRMREAHALTGVAGRGLLRLRRVSLDRFTISRLMTILSGSDKQVDVRAAGQGRPGALHPL